MAVFAYNPVSVSSWSKEVLNKLNGETESVNECSKKFNEQIEKLVQPNVWTGAAASQNYQNFMETHQALITFVNKFGMAFEEAMNSVNKSVNELEVANLGRDANVLETFGTLNYNQISALSEENINKEVIRYDYAAIIDIGNVLNQIKGTLEKVSESLKVKINELNNGTSMWDGEAAEKSKERLQQTLTTNMQKVFESLNVCINNITAAAKDAQAADRG